MITADKTYGINKSTSIYETIKNIEDRLTFLYEMRIPHFVNSSTNVSTVSQAGNINQANSMSDIRQFLVLKG